MGAILIFAFYVLFQHFGFRYVVIAGGLLPALAFLGTLCLQESPIFAQRLILLDHYEDDLLKLTLQEREIKKKRCANANNPNPKNQGTLSQMRADPD